MHTTDVRSNVDDQVVNIARLLGRSKQKRDVFESVYFGKTATKSIASIVARTRLTEKTILTIGRHLAAHHAFFQVKLDGRVAYKKDDFLAARKDEILRLAVNPNKRESIQTKSNPGGGKGHIKTVVKVIREGRPRFRIHLVSIDDVDSFSAARKLKRDGDLPSTISETAFKNGVQKIVKYHYTQKDWGGEINDLSSTLRLGGETLRASFQFKGPAKQGKLTPAKLGKNADQIQRLFTSPAQVFFVQYHSEIADSVVMQMEAFATVKAIATGNVIHYGVIDGEDSARLYRAYPHCFDSHAARKAGKKK